MFQGKSGPATASFPAKKEIVFPADCVESTQPNLVKRKRLTHKDVGKEAMCNDDKHFKNEIHKLLNLCL